MNFTQHETTSKTNCDITANTSGGKTILCNCDDPYESEFFKYFALLFHIIGLKKLIATCYAGSPIAQRQLSLFDTDTPAPNRKPYCAVIECMKDYNGDGDFRSPECIGLLKEADIVATNQPHSLLREYIALLTQYSKKFIILGNINAVTYKEVFPLIMQNKLWMGVTIHSDSCDELQERRLYPYMRLLIRKIADFI